MRRHAWMVLAAAALAGCDAGGAAAPEAPDPTDAAMPPADGGTAGHDASAAAADAAEAAPPGVADGEAGAPEAAVDSGHAAWVPAILGVGYGGLRALSRDDGLTWTRVAELSTSGGDDRDLLRGIAYGNGLWVTVGWRVFVSRDGALTWQEETPSSECGLMEGVAFGGGRFVGTCGEDAYESADGASWTHVGPIGATGGHTYILFVNGAFYASGDSTRSFTSTDGRTWTEMAGVASVAFCGGAQKTRAECPGFWRAGAFLGTEWESKITRSTDGTTFTTVFDDPGNNAPYTPYAFAVGQTPP